MKRIPVVDVFAGPGGLNEGFSALRRDGNPVFEVVASFEMERNAVETLRLRSAVRAVSFEGEYPRYTEFLAGKISRDELNADPAFASALKSAAQHVHQLELGEENRDRVAEIIEGAIEGHSMWVLIGGPPCQAYSLVGRARRTNDVTFEDDHKHFLYREYLDILERFEPPVFVMENVKGLLSAGHRGSPMFDRIMTDLRMGSKYSIRSLVVDGAAPKPSDFVVHAELYGVPQARHRVILVGIREDLDPALLLRLEPSPMATVRHAIGKLKKVRSAASRSDDPEGDWQLAKETAQVWVDKMWRSFPRNRPPAVPAGKQVQEQLQKWFGIGVPLSLHEPRKHMKSDLERYGFLAGMARHGRILRIPDLPKELLPNHRNVSEKNVPFSDRFKVQIWDAPSSTITSHISKDGHYYIHPDPSQMRSLTVREAARLQTFPDDYFFCGNRTSQYHQVGNAVPPLLAYKIAERVARILGR